MNKVKSRTEFPPITIVVTGYDTAPKLPPEGDGSGLLSMIVTHAEVSNSETGEYLGMVGASVDSLVVSLPHITHYFQFAFQDVWKSVEEAQKPGYKALSFSPAELDFIEYGLRLQHHEVWERMIKAEQDKIHNLVVLCSETMRKIQALYRRFGFGELVSK